MEQYEIVGVLETEQDLRRFERTWKDKPKFCKCGAKLSKLQVKCDGCVNQKRREYMKEYAKKKRKAGH